MEIPTIDYNEIEGNAIETDCRLLKALELGLFYISYPKNWEAIIKAGKKFAREFSSSNQSFQGIYSDELPIPIGFSSVTNHQCESFRLITKELWEEHLSQEIIDLGNKLIKLCCSIGKRIFRVLKVPEEHWNELSGGASDGRGSPTLTFNRYLGEKKGDGLPAHKDSGLLTAVFMNRSGLEAWIQDNWFEVDPKEGHLLINFGKGLESMFLTSTHPVKAVEHRVVNIKNFRVSYALFWDRNHSAEIFSFDPKSSRAIPIKNEFGSPMKYFEFQNYHYKSPHGCYFWKKNSKDAKCVQNN